MFFNCLFVVWAFPWRFLSFSKAGPVWTTSVLYPTNILHTEALNERLALCWPSVTPQSFLLEPSPNATLFICHTDWSPQPSAQTLRLEFFNVQITICGHKHGLMHDQKHFPRRARKPLVRSQRQLCVESGTVCESKFHAFFILSLLCFPPRATPFPRD